MQAKIIAPKTMTVLSKTEQEKVKGGQGDVVIVADLTIV